MPAARVLARDRAASRGWGRKPRDLRRERAAPPRSPPIPLRSRNRGCVARPKRVRSARRGGASSGSAHSPGGLARRSTRPRSGRTSRPSHRERGRARAPAPRAPLRSPARLPRGGAIPAACCSAAPTLRAIQRDHVKKGPERTAQQGELRSARAPRHPVEEGVARPELASELRLRRHRVSAREAARRRTAFSRSPQARRIDPEIGEDRRERERYIGEGRSPRRRHGRERIPAVHTTASIPSGSSLRCSEVHRPRAGRASTPKQEYTARCSAACRGRSSTSPGSTR